METFKGILQEKTDVIKEENEIILNEEIDASRICNIFEQDARRYKKFLGDDGKMMYT